MLPTGAQKKTASAIAPNSVLHVVQEEPEYPVSDSEDIDLPSPIDASEQVLGNGVMRMRYYSRRGGPGMAMQRAAQHPARLLFILMIFLFVFATISTLSTMNLLWWLTGQPGSDQLGDHTGGHVRGTAAPERRVQQWPVVTMIFSARENVDRRALLRSELSMHDSHAMFYIGYEHCAVPPELRESEYSCEAKDPRLLQLSVTLAKQYEIAQNAVTARLMKERMDYQDIVLLQMHDFYYNLTRKLKKALQHIVFQPHWEPSAHGFGWQQQDTTRPYWILKVDDDMSAKDVLDFIEFLRWIKPTRATIVGEKTSLHFVWRSCKYSDKFPGVRGNESSLPMWPPMPYGSEGYAISGETAQDIVRHNGVEYHMEDGSMGVWLQEIYGEDGVKWVARNNNFVLDVLAQLGGFFVWCTTWFFCIS